MNQYAQDALVNLMYLENAIDHPSDHARRIRLIRGLRHSLMLIKSEMVNNEED